MSIPIIYEDSYIVCVNKPNDMVVHHAYHSRNVKHEDSLLQTLEQPLYPVHRLDRRTSGIIMLAKQTNYVAKFQELFTKKEIEKTYLGIVRGHTPQQIMITSPVKGRDSKVHKDAETHLQTKQHIELNIPVKPYLTSRYSLVELTPKTGRLHQLRIHMNKISHPLIGDGKYGDKNHNAMFEEQFHVYNLFLHAHTLKFKHPYTNTPLKLVAPPNPSWKKIIDAFEWSV